MMANEGKAKPAKKKPRNQINVQCVEGENPDEVVARELTRPEINAAATIQNMQGDNHEVNALAKELASQIKAVNEGDLTRAEGMLVAQAHTLDEIFNHLAKRSYMNIKEGYLEAGDRYMRLALKAQSQCRATLESLATIKNPPIVYARQANITNGPQQVNNGIPTHAGKNENQQSKLLSGDGYAEMDARRTAAAIGTHQELETVGEINRAENGGG